MILKPYLNLKKIKNNITINNIEFVGFFFYIIRVN